MIVADAPDLPQFDQAVVRYIKDLRIDPQKAIRFQGRLLLKEAMDLTPPKTRGLGRKAVKRDIGRAVRVLRPSELKDRHLRKLARARDYPKLQAAFDAMPDGPLSRKKVRPFTPDLHESARNKLGRVSVNQEAAITLDAEAVRSHIQGKQAAVGRARGGWALGVVRLGGTVPDWIRKWSGTGKFEDRTDNPLMGYIKAENRSEWAGRGYDDRVIARAMEGRAKAIVGDIERKLARAAERRFER